MSHSLKKNEGIDLQKFFKTPFKLELSEAEKKLKEKVELPHMKAISKFFYSLLKIIALKMLKPFGKISYSKLKIVEMRLTQNKMMMKIWMSRIP